MLHAGTSFRGQGFTLVELVIVILLLGILSVYAAGRLYPDFTARQAAEELVQAIRVTQGAAFDNTAFDDDGEVKPPAVQIEADGIRFDLDGDGVADKGSPGGATWALQEPASLKVSIEPTGKVTFDSLGRPTCSGFSCDTAAVSISITARGDTETVTLQPITGYVSR